MAALSAPVLDLKETLQKHEDQLLDYERNVCILCKRLFKSSDHLRRHQSLSEMHSSGLKRLKHRLFNEEQLIKLERKDREALYRDRAMERRLKYGQPDRMIPLEPIVPTETSLLKSTQAVPNPTTPLSRDNKGAALLSKMGWREGIGLGRNNEGMTDILKIESQVGTSGLGVKSHKIDPGLSYKEAVKKIMYQRYYEISSEEENIDQEEV